MRGLEAAETVADVGARCHAETTDLRRAGVRNIVAVEIGRGEDLVFVGARQHLLEHRIRDAVVD